MLKYEFATQVQATPPTGIHPGETPQGGLDDASAVLRERPLINPGQ